jgi:CxxC motif-containing protein (DUF1111 family)
MARALKYIAAISLTAASMATWAGENSPLNLRAFLLGLEQTPALGGGTTRALAAPNAFSFQAANAPREHQRPFSFGNRLFNTNWVEAPASVKSFDGLGPLFNRVSCSGCHTKDGRGQPPVDKSCPMDSMLIRISLPGEDPHGGPRPHPDYGDQISERSLAHVVPEACVTVTYREIAGLYGDGEAYSLRAPSYDFSAFKHQPFGQDVMISPRVAPAMIGLGLLQSITEADLGNLEDEADRDGDGISGRRNAVWDKALQRASTGRFGWKANQPGLLQQNAAAAIGDIGLSTSLFPDENCAPAQSDCKQAINGGSPELSDEFLGKLTLYTMTLAVPAQRNAEDALVKTGAQLFRDMNCAGCHMPTMRTGLVRDYPELSNQTFHPFTDLLLHDMGDELSDNRPDFKASGREWRTPPLWGIGLVPVVNGHSTLLHDGRARNVAEAILWHGGEAEDAKEQFRKADANARAALIAFINSL